jgi:hypothetical protein
VVPEVADKEAGIGRLRHMPGDRTQGRHCSRQGPLPTPLRLLLAAQPKLVTPAL